MINNNAHIAEALNAAVRRQKASERSLAQVPIAVGPGGKMVDATPYLRNLHKAEAHASVYGQVDEHPERYIKDHKPGWRYIWIDTTDKIAMSRVRSRRYEEVLLIELVEDTDLPFTEGPLLKRLNVTHKGTDLGVYLYDLQLVRCSPESFDALFKIRESMGMARIASGVDKLRERASQFDGIEVDLESERVN